MSYVPSAFGRGIATNNAPILAHTMNTMLVAPYISSSESVKKAKRVCLDHGEYIFTPLFGVHKATRGQEQKGPWFILY